MADFVEAAAQAGSFETPAALQAPGADVIGLTEAQTVRGRAPPIDARDGVCLAGARVVRPEIHDHNGVVGVIEAVLLLE
jgi:hypothetical protein